MEQLYPRLDGKKICEHMKNLRIQLARVNDIPYEPVNCPSTGPCAGTCEQCDMEIRYLQAMLQKKEEKERIYPEESPFYRSEETPLPKFMTAEPLMGFLRAEIPSKKKMTEVVIPEFFKKRRDNGKEGKHHE